MVLPITPTLNDVIDTFCKRAIEPTSEDPSQVTAMVRNFVKNQQHENVLEQDIYDGLSEMLPQFGNPLTFFTEIVMPYDDTIQMATVAQKSVEKEAKEVNSRAQNEFTNKRKCIELEREVRAKQTRTSETYGTYGGETYNYNRKFFETGPGEYVLVAPDLSPGKLSHGGTGFILHGEGAHRLFTVRYDECATAGQSVEKDIPYARITVQPFLFSAQKPSRARKEPEKFVFDTADTSPKHPPATEIHTIFFQRDMQQIRRGDGEQRLWVCLE